MWCLLQVAFCATAVVDARGYLGATARGELEQWRSTTVSGRGAAASAEPTEAGYELGDCFFNTMNMRQGKYGFAFHKEHWPHSLAVAYMERTEAKGDYGVLTSLVAGRGLGPPPRSLVVHLRTGDVLDQAGLPLNAFLTHHQPLCWQRDIREVGLVYAQPLRYFENLPIPPGIEEVVIVASTAYHAPYEKAAGETQSREYIAAVANVFRHQGYRVVERLNGDADEAFLFCAKAKYFVPSGGGFSTMASKVVQRLGGRVIGEPITFLDPYHAVRLCLYQGLSLTGLLWSGVRTLGKVVFVERLRVLPVGAQLAVLAAALAAAGWLARRSAALPWLHSKIEGSRSRCLWAAVFAPQEDKLTSKE